MSDFSDKAKHEAEELKGNVKEHVGDLTDNESMEAEGELDQTKARAKQVGDDLKDVVKDAKDTIGR
jgi:uncharacterized protein YjbJ (UPF0337 family)